MIENRIFYLLVLSAMLFGHGFCPIFGQAAITAEIAGGGSKGHSAGGSSGPAALPDDFSKLRLDSFDFVQLDVFGIPELSQELSVDGNGNIVVPLVGPVHVAGQTIRETEVELARLYVEHQMLNSPTVILKLLQYSKQSVSVAGEVSNPGKVQLLAPRSVLDVLSLVGGMSASAGGEVEVRHVDANGVEQFARVPYASGKDAAAAQAAIVYPGDSVYVPKAGVVYVLGAVQRPGGYLMVMGGTLSVPQAVALAQGTTQIASTKEVLIVRKRDGQITKLVVPFSKEQKGDAPVVALADGDMLFVPTSKLKAALVTSQSVITAAASSAVVVGLNH